MAEAVISALLEVLFQNAASLIVGEYRLLHGTKKEVQKLQSVVSTIQAVLEDAEKAQVSDKSLKNWLLKLKDAAYAADDLLDEYKVEGQRCKEMHENLEISGSMIREVCRYFSRSNPVIFNRKMKHQLKEIGARLDRIAGERDKFHLRGHLANNTKSSSVRLQSDSSVFESAVVGRRDDKEKIIQLLTENTKHGDVPVIPIVGMGGLGKTVVAKLVYNDERVVDHFEQRIWVCASEDFDVKKLMKAIVESVTGNRCDLTEMEVVQHRIQELLSGKRFLLVLDDVWDEKEEKWDRLKTSVRHGSEGSKILVTTRNEKIALMVGTAIPYHLTGLSEDDCWLLFEQQAFKYGKPEDSTGLVAIGKEIAKKCRGLPLAAKAVGSLMCLKRQKSEWFPIRDSEIWDLMGDENGIVAALRLSYDHLPPHLKQCFAYCSIFPKNYWINKENLIYLWMAEGFISSSKSKQPEQLGKEYFNELLWRSFFQNVRKDGDDDIVDFQMHGLIHDLAKSVAGVDCSTVEFGKTHIPAGTRHLSMVCSGRPSKLPNGLSNGQKVRSFFLFEIKIPKLSNGLISSFKSIRALDFSGTGIQKVSKSIGTLLHLRYLNLSATLIKRLPRSICDLLNLQTLLLSHCSRLLELPDNLKRLVNLRHLNVYGCVLLAKLPRGIGRMSSLQLLPIFIVSKEAAYGIAELHSLDLHGELVVRNLENLSDARFARDANFRGKKNLQSLKLQWDQVDEASAREYVEQIMENLEPNTSLKKLQIERYMGANFPSWMMSSSLLNIVELSIIKCERCTHLPPLRKLPFLKVLTVDGMDALMYFCSDSAENDGLTGFMSLEELSLKGMPNLLGWSKVEGSSVLNRLKKLTCEGCTNFKHLPDLPSLVSLELHDCNSKLLSRIAARVTSLSHLIFSDFSDLVLPLGLLRNNTRLLSLDIRDCPGLRLVPGELEGLSVLQSLTISNCEALNDFPDLRCLKSLKSLVIHGCHSLLSLPEEGMKSLQSLQYLSLSNCDNLTALPEGMQHLAGLQILHIWSCSNLESLPEWLGNLVSLRELELWYCENLQSLPESMQKLTSLQFLSIWSCPCLKIGSGEDTGQEWYKIQHIPFIKINGPYIQARLV